VSLARTLEERALARRRRLIFAAAAAALPMAFVVAVLVESRAHEVVRQLLTVVS
jgi:hypothetical protein